MTTTSPAITNFAEWSARSLLRTVLARLGPREFAVQLWNDEQWPLGVRKISLKSAGPLGSGAESQGADVAKYAAHHAGALVAAIRSGAGRDRAPNRSAKFSRFPFVLGGVSLRVSLRPSEHLSDVVGQTRARSKRTSAHPSGLVQDIGEYPCQ
jgi:hypothetical protein